MIKLAYTPSQRVLTTEAACPAHAGLVVTVNSSYLLQLVKERSWIDPDFRERSLTKRFVPARALLFSGVKKL